MRAIDFPFRLGPAGRVVTTDNYSQIVRAHAIDGLMTNFQERVMRPRHGCDCQGMLFEPTNLLVTKDQEEMLSKRLTNSAPRVLLDSMKITSEDFDPNVVIVTVNYRATPQGTPQQVRVPVSTQEAGQ